VLSVASLLLNAESRKAILRMARHSPTDGYKLCECCI